MNVETNAKTPLYVVYRWAWADSSLTLKTLSSGQGSLAKTFKWLWYTTSKPLRSLQLVKFHAEILKACIAVKN